MRPPGPPGVAESVAHPPAALSVRSRAGRVVLLTAVLGSSLAGIDATVVGIALPQIGRTLDASFALCMSSTYERTDIRRSRIVLNLTPGNVVTTHEAMSST